MKTKDAFCSNCQTTTPHTVAVDLNGEIVFTCTTEDCGRFIKFPTTVTAEEIQRLLSVHEEHNKGQVSVAAAEKTVNDLLDKLDGVSSDTNVPAEDQTAVSEPVQDVAGTAEVAEQPQAPVEGAEELLP